MSFIAVLSIGAIAVPMNAWWTTEELDYGIEDSGSRVVIADRQRMERLAPLADKFDLKRDIQFSSRVTGATYDESSKRWTITTENGDTYSSQFFVMGAGGLSVPLTPDIPGVEDFQGIKLHRYKAYKWHVESRSPRGLC